MSNKNPSWSTISTLINSMLGGAMLTLPILYRQSGIISGLIILFVSGLISYKTCSLYVVHMSEQEDHIENTIDRISGQKWQKIFKGLTGYYLVCLNIIYIELIEDQGYGIIYYILGKAGHEDWIAPTDATTVVFDQFSMQYMSLLSLLPLLAMTFIKDISLLIRLTALGVVSVGIYMIFILYEFFGSVGDTNFNDLPLFNTNFGDLAGTCAIAFTIHTVVNPIMKANKDQSKNMRDLKISYVLGFILYASIGVMGCVSILDKKCKDSITNCYLSSWQDLLVQISYLIGRITVFPCFFEIARTRILEFHFGEVKESHFKIINWAFMILSTILVFLSPYISLDLIMNLVGSLVCFFFVYLIPTKFHFDCLYGSQKQNVDSLLQSEQDGLNNQNEGQPKCVHDRAYAKRFPKVVRYVFYGVINLTGVAVGIYGIYQFITELTKSS